MSDSTPAANTVYRSQYTSPAYLVDQVELQFDLDPHATIVSAKLSVRRNPGSTAGPALELNGEGLTLQSISVDGSALDASQYQLADDVLTLTDLPDTCVIETSVVVDPTANRALSGLYRTSGNFCTQCEAQGFRRITFFPDRPDVMSTYKVTIRGDRAVCPIMLSNGNRVSQSELPDGRHEAVWEDPHPKPCYLFALVAGDLKCHSGSFTTASGREVKLEIWVEQRNLDQCEHALVSLQKSMLWDEQVFGLEYDLDIYMIVAVDDFNMGAMENKGLNVFNSKYVLAAVETATDDDFLGVEAVIAHEYFHNWTGNRVTCRDWFQLTLKEGLTVFRDQQFTTDQTSAAVKRIDDVISLRGRQFAEDSGPMAHPIRPESYIAMDNFYTATVYDKGAEIIRMYHTLLHADGFRAGIDLYFQRHDNDAVTCDDFRAAMADANGFDLSLMDRWYSQPGTPELVASEDWQADTGTYTLTLQQSYPSLPDTIPGAADRKPVPIPVRLGLLGSDGSDMIVKHDSIDPSVGASFEVFADDAAEQLLTLNSERASWSFTGLKERPVASLLRGFSAPVRLSMKRDDEQLAFLMAHDSDTFNRWDAGQTLAKRLLVAHVMGDADVAKSTALYLDAIGKQIRDTSLDGSYLSLLLTLPSEATIGQEVESIDPDKIHAVRHQLLCQIAQAHDAWLRSTYDRLSEAGPYSNNQSDIDDRRLKNTALKYLTFQGSDESLAIAATQYRDSDNMTDTIAALGALAQHRGTQSAAALDAFYDRFKTYPLVLDKWFAIQAISSSPDTLGRVQELTQHDDFTLSNPNRVRALIQTFTMNEVRFHQSDGAGYGLLADYVIRIDKDNPQLASRMVSRLNSYRKFEPIRQSLMRTELERIAAVDELSKDVREIVERALQF